MKYYRDPATGLYVPDLESDPEISLFTPTEMAEIERMLSEGGLAGSDSDFGTWDYGSNSWQKKVECEKSPTGEHEWIKIELARSFVYDCKYCSMPKEKYDKSK